MKYSKSNTPLKCIMKNSTNYKSGETMTIKGIMVHSTGCANPTLKRYVQPYETDSNYNDLIKLIGKNTYKNDFNHTKYLEGMNAFIGELADKTVTSVQTLPWNMSPWGCYKGSKGSCNNGWIQFEICEPYDLKDKTYFEKAYNETIELLAYLCQEYNLDPKGKTTCGSATNVPVILCHKDGANLGLASNHADVYHWFNNFNKTMDDVRNDVAKLIAPSKVETPKVTEKVNTNYLVYPTETMNITQSYSGKTSHLPHTTVKTKDYPIDEACVGSLRNYFHCPCDEIEIKYLRGPGASPNVIWLESTSKVKFANGEEDYFGMMVEHSDDEDIKKLKVGQKFKRGEKIAREGTSGNVTGNHLHIAIGKGKLVKQSYYPWAENENKKWVITTTVGAMKPEDAFYTDPEFNKIKNDAGLKFKKLDKTVMPKVEKTNTTSTTKVETFKPYTVRITAGLLNVRNDSNINSKINTTVPKGGVYTIIEEKNGWGKLKSGAGWINLDYTEKT